VTLIDLSPERLETKPIWVLRVVRWPAVAVAVDILILDFGLRISDWVCGNSRG
jgi:hypothetical protein